MLKLYLRERTDLKESINETNFRQNRSRGLPVLHASKVMHIELISSYF